MKFIEKAMRKYKNRRNGIKEKVSVVKAEGGISSKAKCSALMSSRRKVGYTQEKQKASQKRDSIYRNGYQISIKNRTTRKREVQVNVLLESESWKQDNSSSPRPISIVQLNTLLCLHLRPIKLVVYKRPYSFKMMGYLILRRVSRLDAFSVYHFRTRLPGYALGRTTDAPEVRPTRSSRTKVSSSQISNAHDR